MGKKAFTLVELAIVLVVIGMILGIAIKGKTLIEHAEARRLVANVQKISTAFYVYHSKYNKYPGGFTKLPEYQNYADNNSRKARLDLVDLGIVSEKDFKVGLGVAQLVFVSVGDVQISMQDGSDGLGFDWNGGNYHTFKHVAIEFAKNNPANPRGYSGTSSDKLLCYVETILDDEHIAYGLGRVAFPATLGTVYNISSVYRDYDPVVQFSNCYKQSESIKRASDGYAFQVF